MEVMFRVRMNSEVVHSNRNTYLSSFTKEITCGLLLNMPAKEFSNIWFFPGLKVLVFGT